MFVLGRIEDNYAVIEYESSTFNIPISLLPEDAKEGDILRFQVEIGRNKKPFEGEAGGRGMIFGLCPGWGVEGMAYLLRSGGVGVPN